MAAKPNTLETVRLALELFKRIPKIGQVSAPELHRQLTAAGWRRDLRTVQRQLDELSQHFDIERDDRSRPYGYRWKDCAQGFSIPGLSRQESLLLLLAQQQLANILPASFMKSLSAFFTQAQSNLAVRSDAQLEREWMVKVRVVSATQPLLPPKLQSGVLEAVSDALYRNHWLEVQYTNIRGKRTSSRVMPLGLAQQGPRLFLVCRFEGFDDDRTLALQRIKSATVTNMAFERPRGFNLQRFDDDGRFGFGAGKNIHLKFWIRHDEGAQLLETPLSNDQIATEKVDGFVIAATVVDTEQLKWWLRGFGDAVKLISPKGLLG